MNELDNHDHSRFLTRTNHRVGRVANVGPYAAAENTNKAVLREAVVIQMTWPGARRCIMGMSRARSGLRIRITGGRIPGDRRSGADPIL